MRFDNVGSEAGTVSHVVEKNFKGSKGAEEGIGWILESLEEHGWDGRLKGGRFAIFTDSVL